MHTNNITKTLIFLSASLFLIAGLVIGDAHAGTTYIYYPDGRVKSITYSPAQDGKTYEEYLDEDLFGLGYGRTYRRILSSVDSDGAIAYQYSNSRPTTSVAFNSNGDGKKESLVVDFGGKGFYKYSNNVWTFIGTASPESVAIADLDSNGVDDLVVNYGPTLGLWKYVNGSTLTQMGTASPKKVIAVDFDGDGKKDDLVIDYGPSLGLWKYTNGTAYTRMGTASVVSITVADLDSNGVDDLVIDYGSSLGLWKYMNGTAYTQMGTASPKSVVAVDFDGDGKKDDLVIDYGPSLGLWKYTNGTTYTRMGTASVVSITVADLDSNGVDDLVIDYGPSLGLWKYMNGTTYTQMGAASPKSVVAVDFDGDGKKDDLVIDYGASLGLWKCLNGTVWSQISTSTAQGITVVDLDSNGMDDLVIDYGKPGVYKYLNGSSLVQMATLNSDRTDVAEGYSNSDFTGLVYTATYDASGKLISKTEYYSNAPFLKKRMSETSTNDIFEYLNENWNSQGWGRVITHFDSSENVYRTYSWGASQVTVTQYAGGYAPAKGSAVQSDVVAGERRAVYVYDHKDQEVNLTYPANGWVKRQETQYGTDGVTVQKRIKYGFDGLVTTEEDSVTNVYKGYTYYPMPDASAVHYIDEAVYRQDVDMVFNGNAQLDSAYKKFGSSALLFDGSGDYVTAVDLGTNLGSNPFTMEFWVRFNSITGTQTIISQGTNGDSYSHISWTGSGWRAYYGSGADFTVPDTISAGTWYHVALVRNGNTFTVYRDGQAKGSAVNSMAIPDYTGVLCIGDTHYGTGNLGTYLNGSVDEIRATYGARWTSNFTVPTEPSEVDRTTYCLISADGADGATASKLLYRGDYTRSYEYNIDGSLKKVQYKKPGLEYYTMESPYKLKREITAGSDVYERLNEAYGGNDYGRMTLLYDYSDGVYRTYDWGASQVIVNVYKGAYLIDSGDAVRHGVVEADKIENFVYDHKGQEVNLDTTTNGWLAKEHTVYGVGGKYYTYTYFALSPNRVKYMEERDTVSGPVIATYTYFYANGQHYISGKLEANGAYTKYYYNTSWQFTGAEWQSADRLTVRKYDPDWNLTLEKTFTGTPFMRGVNLPWLEYGFDVGTCTTSSVAHKGYSSDEIRLFDGNAADKFRGLADWRGDFVRIFIFGDMRSGITFSADGKATGIQPMAYTDMQALCDAAKLLGIKLIPVLLDFKMADGDGGAYTGEHADCITDETVNGKRDALINQLGNFVNHFKDESSIYAWEIMNEPEEIDQTYHKASWVQLQNFVKAMANEIHTEDPGSLVTLGSQDRYLLQQYWTDAALGNPGASYCQDLYQFHYYNIMENVPTKKLDVPCPSLGKPVLMGEVDPTQDAYNNKTVAEKLNNIYGNGYTGGLFWEDDSTKYPTLSDAAYAGIQNWAYGNVPNEYYVHEPTNYLKRKTEVSGNIYEYIDENFDPDGSGTAPALGWGRYKLIYNKVEGCYYTYFWPGYDGWQVNGQVKVEKYQGSYSPVAGSAVWSDVVPGEKQETAVYAHNGQQVNLNLATNGWLIQEQIIYSSDKKYTFEYYTAPYQTEVHYKREYINSTSALYATYTYDTAGNLTGVVLENETVKNYDSGRMKRKVDINGNIYEYMDENFESQGYGRYKLIYDAANAAYKTYLWGNESGIDAVPDGQVRVEEYEGSYAPSPLDSAVWSDVAQLERRTTYVYDHNGTQANVDTSANGWKLRLKTIYASDGNTVNEKYSYYADGKMKRKILSTGTDSGDITEYSSVTDGRITLFYDASEGKYRTYEWTADQVTVVEYAGTYIAGIDDSTAQGVQSSQKRKVTIYDHNGQTSTINASVWTKKKEEIFNSSAVWSETDWFYDDSNNLLYRKLLATAEADGTIAAEYYNVSGYKSKTCWKQNGAISGLYMNGSSEWYYSGSGDLEAYTWYSTGRNQWKDVYKNVGGTWTLYLEQHRLNSGENPWGDWDPANPYNGVGKPSGYLYSIQGDQHGAPVTRIIPAVPQRTDTSSLKINLDLISSADDTLIPESMQLFYDKLDALKADSTGEGVLVALLDSGVDSGKLNAKLVRSLSFTNTQNVINYTSHGTKMASVISDVASGVELIDAQVFDNNRETDSYTVAEAIRASVDMGAKVISMSFTLFPVADDLKSAIDHAASKNVVLIAAAGNEGTEILNASLAAQDKVITVGAVDKDGKVSAWSNYGEEVDLYAPWEVIEQSAERKAQSEAGTSYSAALVAGIAALMLETDPSLTADEVLGELKGLMGNLSKSPVTSHQSQVASLEKELGSKQAVLEKQKEEFTGTSVKDTLVKTVNE